MIVVMKNGATEEEIQHMIERVEALGLSPTSFAEPSERSSLRSVTSGTGIERRSKVVQVSTRSSRSSPPTKSPAWKLSRNEP